MRLIKSWSCLWRDSMRARLSGETRVGLTFWYLLVWVLRWFFFFSSRRRHTRYWRDWSSDVCSSDLEDRGARVAVRLRGAGRGLRLLAVGCIWRRRQFLAAGVDDRSPRRARITAAPLGGLLELRRGLPLRLRVVHDLGVDDLARAHADARGRGQFAHGPWRGGLDGCGAGAKLLAAVPRRGGAPWVGPPCCRPS